MIEYSVSKKFDGELKVTDKVRAMMRLFGLIRDRFADTQLTYSCDLKIEAGYIVYITGPSGSGKTVLLKEFEKKTPKAKRINLNQIKLTKDRAVIDCIDDYLITVLQRFSSAGLNDCKTLLSTPAKLSEGQKYRFRLAMALAAKKQFVFADEFCCSLDRITAAGVAYNIRKFANRHGVTFFLASSHRDLLLDLAPDVIVTRDLSGSTQTTYKYSFKRR